jgi:hypothetical protein
MKLYRVYKQSSELLSDLRECDIADKADPNPQNLDSLIRRINIRYLGVLRAVGW